MKSLLVTGGAGFIGSCFVRRLLVSSPEKHNVINLDALTYAGNLENLKLAENNQRYIFIKGDICDRSLLEKIFSKYEIDGVINFAAESHVDRSIENPEEFIRTNIMGTQALLDAAKKYWKLNSSDKYCAQYRDGVKFIQVSTDEVYGELGPSGLFSESTPLSPNSPYSASKASADLLALAYHNTFGLPINVTRCSNNYGPYQFPEKLIPLMINNCLNDKPLPVYGNGLQVRDWLHVEDHCEAILAVLEKGNNGEIYNIGGNCERTNIEVVKAILKILKKPESLISYVKDRPGHDKRYAINNAKIKNNLGWAPKHTFETGIDETIDWYLKNEEWLNRVVNGKYTDYYERMYGEKNE
ncbi:MAG: dTDP-glucose 4,6-dehydratase [Eubacterium sp.]|jgi:dTDP-glucose 4,6-dehydratase|nr:dTDP-glucose 4,6-dehydratase [Eubacterium sp.]